MLNRSILQALRNWSANSERKPLVLRGARQVGKTTAVKMLGAEYDTFISLNLDNPTDRAIFSPNTSLSEIMEAIYFVKNISKNNNGRTLLFIDEIQKSPEAVSLLRYFYEDYPHLHVIAAGSLLETLLDPQVSFPVGRVQFMVLHPFSFAEFLNAIDEQKALDALNTIPCPAYAHTKLSELFRKYLLVGGMPEAVKIYGDSRDLVGIDTVHESLLIAYTEDVEKYAPSNRQVPIIRHVITAAWPEAAGRIKYEGFGNSNYKSREIKEAFAILQKAFLFDIMHPVTSTTLPLQPDLKKSPRLHTLDTGLVVYKTGMRKALFTSDNISSVYSGRIVEHIVGQELMSHQYSPMYRLNFWARDKNQSNAEVDYVIPYHDQLIPVEVKSGASGRLRSLHAFINESKHGLAVRFYQGTYAIEKAETIAKKPYTLINIPLYQASKLQEYLDYTFPI